MSQPHPPAPCYFLANRQQYATCHIQVPDCEHRLSAITVGGALYSFFQVVPDPRKALSILTKFTYRGEAAVIRTLSKGYSIWVEEPGARLVKPTRSSKRLIPPNPPLATCTILVDRYPYQTCEILVSDLSNPIQALCVDGRFYSIFKVDVLPEQAITSLTKLVLRGDDVLLKISKLGTLIAVVEPDATLVTSK